MNLYDLMSTLAHGELSNLSLVTNGAIAETAHRKVVSAINATLTDIYTRIPLHEKELIVRTLEWKSLYLLRKQFALTSGSQEQHKYILDSQSYPFTGDIVRILSVTNEVGDPLPLNDPEQWAAVFTPYYDAVQFTHPSDNQIFTVQYQALHPKLALEPTESMMQQQIMLPPVLEELLVLGTASRVIAPIGGQTQTLRAQYLDTAYESKLTFAQLRNDVGDTGTATNVKLMLRGYP